MVELDQFKYRISGYDAQIENIKQSLDLDSKKKRIEELEAEGGVLNETIDVNGKIREKYTIMTNFFKSKYQFDIQAIGNDIEH